MIKKLQRRFIRITLIALTVAMVLVLVIVNLSNWITVRSELLETAALIADSQSAPPVPDGQADPPPDAPDGPSDPSGTPPADVPTGQMEPQGTPPSDAPGGNSGGPGGPGDPGGPQSPGQRDLHTRNMMSESSWVSVLQDSSGQYTVEDQRLTDNNGEDNDTFISMADEVIQGGKTSSFMGDYAYVVRTTDLGSTVYFLNGETRITAARTLMVISAAACAGGILLAWLFVTVASRKAVEPTLRNMEQQKRFITDASHELKTPLTVISASMELLQTEIPGNQWVKSTQKQTAMMRRLVDELVYLSRMEEEDPSLSIEPLRVSKILEEAAEPFAAMAEFQGRDFKVDSDSSLWISGDRASIQRLLSTLCDNAVKYAEGEGDILVSGKAEGKHAVISVSNPVAEPLTKVQCERMFDRFYRADQSRNKEKKGGFGIGLAIAAAIAEKNGGDISAAMDGNRLRITCRLPRCSAPS